MTGKAWDHPKASALRQAASASTSGASESQAQPSQGVIEIQPPPPPPQHQQQQQQQQTPTPCFKGLKWKWKQDFNSKQGDEKKHDTVKQEPANAPHEGVSSLHANVNTAKSPDPVLQQPAAPALGKLGEPQRSGEQQAPAPATGRPVEHQRQGEQQPAAPAAGRAADNPTELSTSSSNPSLHVPAITGKAVKEEEEDQGKEEDPGLKEDLLKKPGTVLPHESSAARRPSRPTTIADDFDDALFTPLPTVASVPKLFATTKEAKPAGDHGTVKRVDSSLSKGGSRRDVDALVSAAGKPSSSAHASDAAAEAGPQLGNTKRLAKDELPSRKRLLPPQSLAGKTKGGSKVEENGVSKRPKHESSRENAIAEKGTAKARRASDGIEKGYVSAAVAVLRRNSSSITQVAGKSTPRVDGAEALLPGSYPTPSNPKQRQLAPSQPAVSGENHSGRGSRGRESEKEAGKKLETHSGTQRDHAEARRTEATATVAAGSKRPAPDELEQDDREMVGDGGPDGAKVSAATRAHTTTTADRDEDTLSVGRVVNCLIEGQHSETAKSIDLAKLRSFKDLWSQLSSIFPPDLLPNKLDSKLIYLDHDEDWLMVAPDDVWTVFASCATTLLISERS